MIPEILQKSRFAGTCLASNKDNLSVRVLDGIKGSLKTIGYIDVL